MPIEPTQKEKVLALVSRREGACLVSFLHHAVPRYSARVHELRSEGKTIHDAPCTEEGHRGHPRYYLAPSERLFDL